MNTTAAAPLHPRDTITEVQTWRTKGFTEDITTCEHCGRAGLKGTVLMVLVDADGMDGTETYMGTTCAARMTGRLVKDITTEARRADRDRDAAVRLAWSTWNNARSTAFCARRDAALGRDARFEAIRTFMTTAQELTAQAAWDAENPQPACPWAR